MICIGARIASPSRKSKIFLVLNYCFGNGEFNHLIIILTPSLVCGPKLPLNKCGPTHEIFNILNGS